MATQGVDLHRLISEGGDPRFKCRLLPPVFEPIFDPARLQLARLLLRLTKRFLESADCVLLHEKPALRRGPRLLGRVQALA